ncbi:TIGR04104 family putative zinc finger protein [Salinicoccus sesuvii]|uniref:TIGR04104 family putative zinc finger protein n=1 Tax=Salinicoccus sesuvii TaxID=868281 RepID=A0ABV7N4R7_9STAP
MTRCAHCGNRWTIGDKLRESFKFSFDRSMTCPYCGEKQYLTRRYMKKSMLITFLMSLIMFLPSFFSVTWQVHVAFIIISIPTAFFLILYTFELTSAYEGDFWDDQIR